VLAAQRDRYLPLRVIREQLDAIDNGARRSRGDHGERVVGLAPLPVASVPPQPRGEVGDPRLTREQLIERSGLDEAGVRDLEAVRAAAARTERLLRRRGPDRGQGRRPAGRVRAEGRHLRPTGPPPTGRWACSPSSSRRWRSRPRSAAGNRRLRLCTSWPRSAPSCTVPGPAGPAGRPRGLVPLWRWSRGHAALSESTLRARHLRPRACTVQREHEQPWVRRLRCAS
jgi:hypothetical protein